LETINTAIRNHETSMPWEFQQLATTLYQAFDTFNRDFFGEHLLGCIFKFEPINIKRFSVSRPDVNGIGAEHEIVLNTKHLYRPLYQVLGMLAHQLTHQWQELREQGGDRNFHNRAFQAKSREMGLPCGEGYRCEIVEYTSAFFSVVETLGQDLYAAAMPGDRPPPRSSSTLKKWSCGCMNLWAAVEVTGHCDACGEAYQQKD
jgi:hypothetical protein